MRNLMIRIFQFLLKIISILMKNIFIIQIVILRLAKFNWIFKLISLESNFFHIMCIECFFAQLMTCIHIILSVSTISERIWWTECLGFRIYIIKRI